MAIDLLIKSARIIDPDSDHHNQHRDILIRQGEIAEIAPAGTLNATEGTTVFEQEGCCVSPGWFDSFASFCDPGYEHREDIHSGVAAAAAGGFTAVAVTPETKPVLHSKAEIEYVINKAEKSAVNLYPIGAVSRSLNGTDITEMNDMRSAGAIAFGEGSKSVHHPGLLLRALQYVIPFNGLIISTPVEPKLAGAGQMHEGPMSTHLGMPGIPVLAETVMLQRDISILEYAESRLHFPLLSSKEGVELVRAAKAKGLQLTAGVCAYQLLLEDSAVATYETNFKVSPPLRSAEDREALKEGVLDGTIDVICSHHQPQDEDGKRVEFEFAAHGIGAIEHTFGLILQAFPDQKPETIEKLVSAICHQPRKIFGLPSATLKIGETADLTLFDPAATYTPQATLSRAYNNPFIGKKLSGKVLGVFNKGKFVSQLA